jgi:hypothetical protein
MGVIYILVRGYKQRKSLLNATGIAAIAFFALDQVLSLYYPPIFSIVLEFFAAIFITTFLLYHRGSVLILSSEEWTISSEERIQNLRDTADAVNAEIRDLEEAKTLLQEKRNANK